MTKREPAAKVGLVLPGGGARAAYQVGVLKAIAELLPAGAANPFRIIVGSSAGSMNAASLAGNAEDFKQGVERLAGVWENLKSESVIRADAWSVLRHGLGGMLALVTTGLNARRPHCLLDNAPLRTLLGNHIRFSCIQPAIDTGLLDALAITASGYTSARSITFFQGRAALEPWERTRRFGLAATIELDHVMASIALPVIFPAVRIDREYFGDGSMRQLAPLSPAVHLGARRILVIGVRNESPDALPPRGAFVPYPSFGQIGGYMLDALFMDSIHTDLERMQRINRIMQYVPERVRRREDAPHLRTVDTAVVMPSEDIRDIALRHANALPPALKAALKRVGGLSGGSTQLLSYLLFEGSYCRELIELGYRDGLAQRRKLSAFVASETLSAEEA
jgi:NTE family protein